MASQRRVVSRATEEARMRRQRAVASLRCTQFVSHGSVRLRLKSRDFTPARHVAGHLHCHDPDIGAHVQKYDAIAEVTATKRRQRQQTVYLGGIKSPMLE